MTCCNRSRSAIKSTHTYGDLLEIAADIYVSSRYIHERIRNRGINCGRRNDSRPCCRETEQVNHQEDEYAKGILQLTKIHGELSTLPQIASVIRVEEATLVLANLMLSALGRETTAG